MATQLFTIPIASLPSGSSSSTPEPQRTITCTSPSPRVYLLTISSPPDNRLTTPFCQAIILALDILQFSYPLGPVITTSSIPKFYSNGLDLEHATTTPGFWSNAMFALFRRFLTYPAPTISLLNGHAFAGGIMLAMYHDYRLCAPTRGFFCLNELELGIPLKAPMSSIFRQKLPPAAYHAMVLEAKRFSGQGALDAKLVDGLGGLEECLGFIKEKGFAERAKKGIYDKGVYAELKMEMYRETLGYIDGFEAEEGRWAKVSKKEEEINQEAQKRFEAWAKKSGKSRL